MGRRECDDVGELEIASTLCNEIRDSGEAVVIDCPAGSRLPRSADGGSDRQYSRLRARSARRRAGCRARVDPALAAALDQVVAEFRAAQPHRVLTCGIILTEPVACDSRRIAQLLSNLIANALTHGDPKTPVAVTGRTETRFTLTLPLEP